MLKSTLTAAALALLLAGPAFADHDDDYRQRPLSHLWDTRHPHP